MPKGFFPMPRRERIALFGLILFSIVAFLPIWGGVTVSGVVFFGWFMAALLLGSPLLMLALLLRETPAKAGRDRRTGDQT